MTRRKRRPNHIRQTIKVLKGFNGQQGQLVETIERIPTRHTGRTRKQNRAARRYKTVSYKGSRYRVFVLPECYGQLAGQCISLD